MSFQDDYFRRILEGVEETREQKAAHERAGQAPDTIDRIDARLAEYHRHEPGRLATTVAPQLIEEADALAGRLDELFVMRTSVVVELQKSPLSDDRVLFLARSLLVGTARMIDNRERPPSPTGLLARVLRQERVARLLSPREVAHAWQVVFEIEADRGRYDRAEDALFHAIELRDNPCGLIRDGIDFYKTLEDAPDDRLRAGGLSAREVDRAKWELLEKLDAAQPST